MICDFSGLVGKKVKDKKGFSGTILGVYLHHEGIFLFVVYGAIDTRVIFILQQDENKGNIIEVESGDFYKNFSVI